MDLGFDYVYDTVSSSFTDGQVWIVRNGSVSPLAGAGKGSINPIPRPDGRALLVKRLDDSGGPSGGLAVIDLAGHVVQAVPGTADCFPGGWIDNATVVIGCGGTDPGSWHVLRVSLNGGGRHVIAPDDPGDAPSVSADGRMVAYGYQQQTWVVPTSGGTPRKVLTASEGGSWSPDGSHLAITGHGSDGNELFLVNADGSGSRKVADITRQGDTSATFSPDGQRIVFAGSSDTPYNFWVVNTNGRGLRELDPSVTGGDPQRIPGS